MTDEDQRWKSGEQGSEQEVEKLRIPDECWILIVLLKDIQRLNDEI
jgi:hypothetical protein